DSPIEKDNTGNIFSLMVYNGYFPPVLLISPAEVDKMRIVQDQGYEFAFPDRAEDPATALWDPGMSGVPNEIAGMHNGIGRGRRPPAGNTSYAHMTPFGPRRATWQSTFGSNEAVIANRGAQYTGEPGAWYLVPGITGMDSNSVKLYGIASQWRGN